MSPVPDTQLAATGDAAGWHQQGLRLRAAQDMVGATNAFTRAAALAPDDLAILLGLAQTRHAAGLPAVDLFRRAAALAPDHLEIARQWATALAAEGELTAAETLLLARLALHPDWLDGHKCLATMRWTAGRREDFLDSFRAACRAQPRNVQLRLAWFYTLATQRDWTAAARVLDEGEAALGDRQPFVLARLYLACETLVHGEAEQLLAETAAVRDAGVDLCRMRYYLRAGQLPAADAAGERLCSAPAARMAWPYRSLIWRLQRDPRAEWLDGKPPWVKTIDLDFTPAQLAELAALLRRLHTASTPYLEQSVRGGTQTDRPLFFRSEAIVQLTRDKVVDAISSYVAALPAPDAAHPLLGVRRDASVLFSGSGSVRLRPQGFHVSHTHPMGWISSALYVALPEATQLGPAPAGWIGFGSPPAELGLNLATYCQVEPRPGRLVLFPSTLWHSTEPFAAGERLVVSFDVSLPRA